MSGKKNHKKCCERYKSAGTKEKNRTRRINRHIRLFPGDKQAAAALAGTYKPVNVPPKRELRNEFTPRGPAIEGERDSESAG